MEGHSIEDNCTAHLQPRGLTHIELIFLPPNTTAKSQPCDQGIIHYLKVYYHMPVLCMFQHTTVHRYVMALFAIKQNGAAFEWLV